MKGRWSARDLFISENNFDLYIYIKNNPVLYTDLLGLRRFNVRNKREKQTYVPSGADFNPDGINCIGYATGMDGDLQPRKLSLSYLFRKLRWRCKKIGYDDECSEDKNKPCQLIMVVYIHSNPGTINGVKMNAEETFKWIKKHRAEYDFWTIKRFWHSDDPVRHIVDFHGVKKEKCPEKGKEWSFVPRRCDTKLPIEYTSDPNTTSYREITFAKYCCKKDVRQN